MRKINNRIGETNINTYGSKMEIIDYNGASDIIVEFINNHYIIRTTYDQFNKGTIKNPYDKSLFGIGYLGEGKYKTTINRKSTPQYASWKSMLMRCYDKNFQQVNSSYKVCTVCDEWHNFQNFAKWYDNNYYEVKGQIMNLDKDIIMKNNKLYSPETCVFVPKPINNMFTKSIATRGQLPVGVFFNKNLSKMYFSQCSNRGEQITIGYFDTLVDAFQAYKEYKEKLIKDIAKEYQDQIPTILYNGLMNYIVEIDD